MEEKKKKTEKSFTNICNWKWSPLPWWWVKLHTFFRDLQALYKNPGQLTLSGTSVPEDTNRFSFSHTSKRGETLNNENKKAANWYRKNLSYFCNNSPGIYAGNYKNRMFCLLFLIEDYQTSIRLQNTSKLQIYVKFLVLKKPDGIFIHVFKIFALWGMTSGNMLLVFMNAKRETVT